MFVRLPGMASFESKSSIDELVQYFQATLPGQNWVEKEPPFQVEGATVLSYQRDVEGVEIQIEVNPGGVAAWSSCFFHRDNKFRKDSHKKALPHGRAFYGNLQSLSSLQPKFHNEPVLRLPARR